MPSSIITTVLALSRPSSGLLKFPDSYSLGGTSSNPSQTHTNLIAGANPSQTLYHTHTAPHKRLSASLPSSCFVPSVKTINLPAVNTQN